MAEAEGGHGALAQELVLVALNHNETIAQDVAQETADVGWFGKVVGFVHEDVRQQPWFGYQNLTVQGGQTQEFLTGILLDDVEEDIPRRPIDY